MGESSLYDITVIENLKKRKYDIKQNFAWISIKNKSFAEETGADVIYGNLPVSLGRESLTVIDVAC